MKKQAIAKLCASIALMSLLLSGCKQEKPAEDDFFDKISDNNVQATMPQAEAPTQPTQKQTGISLNLPEESYWEVLGYCPSQSYELYQDQIWQYITGAQIVEK